jgi:hypothetical protein
MAGYSAKSLAEKLGLLTARMSEPGRQALFLAEPPGYGEVLGALPPVLAHRHAASAQAAGKSAAKNAPFDFIQAFYRTGPEMASQFPVLKGWLAADGMLWISWPKSIKGRKPVPEGLTEAQVRETGLAAGLVDVKVCAVDETWSGLKFVYRLKDRT